MSEPLPDSELRAVLESSAPVQPMPAGARERVRARLQNVIAVAGEPLGPHGRPGRSVVARTVTAALGGVAFGMVVGVAIGWTVASSEVSAPAEPAPTQESGPAQPPAPLPPNHESPPARPEPVEPEQSPRLVDPPPTTEPTVRQRTSGGTLAAERRLIDAAFAAHRRGNAGEAMRSLDRHARRFPDGVLAPEREALRARLQAPPSP